jgi:hypothetical protein
MFSVFQPTNRGRQLRKDPCRQLVHRFLWLQHAATLSAETFVPTISTNRLLGYESLGKLVITSTLLPDPLSDYMGLTPS